MFRNLIIFVIFSFSILGSNERNTVVQILADSSLCVEGRTNVNTFNCDFDVSAMKDKIPISYVFYNEFLEFTNATLVLNNNCFDCGHKVMNNDFKKLLKTESYPQIVMTLDKLFLNTEKKGMVEALVRINLAGVEQQYRIPVHVSKTNEFNVNGQLHLNISDFELNPPQKMLGMVKVKDRITINFDFLLESI